MEMPKAQRGSAAKSPPSKKKNFTIWADVEDGERIERAVAAVAERNGYPVSISAWLLAQAIKGVEEEEKRGKGRG